VHPCKPIPSDLFPYGFPAETWYALLISLIKGKVVPVLNLIKHYAMKAYGGVDVQIHIFLTSALVGGEWSASRSGRFTPGKELPVPIV
jgi:hypothetical protein